MVLFPGGLLVGEGFYDAYGRLLGRIKEEFGGKGFLLPSIIDIFYVGTLYTDRLQSTDASPWSHYEKSFGCHRTHQYSPAWRSNIGEKVSDVCEVVRY